MPLVNERHCAKNAFNQQRTNAPFQRNLIDCARVAVVALRTVHTRADECTATDAVLALITARARIVRRAEVAVGLEVVARALR